jgi:hypothetical protein
MMGKVAAAGYRETDEPTSGVSDIREIVVVVHQ